MANPKEKDPVDIVHQNVIHVETIMKELRHQKLYTEFNINPVVHFFILTDKPMSNITYRKEEEDRKYFHHIVSDRSDRRLHFPWHNSEITKYMDAAWRLKEQTQNLE
ncbi:protein FAM183A-like [Sinocyclocheilus grahami]|uniref:protein FAM183A-like n=1 Tax=Sinocyclocheilus grahami TaxID=75366 RepID=UPI0007ACDB4D|nr:PREDICTED: protein FAM183A-like [Sinocyclocheilus grahami]